MKNKEEKWGKKGDLCLCFFLPNRVYVYLFLEDDVFKNNQTKVFNLTTKEGNADHGFPYCDHVYDIEWLQDNLVVLVSKKESKKKKDEKKLKSHRQKIRNKQKPLKIRNGCDGTTVWLYVPQEI